MELKEVEYERLKLTGIKCPRCGKLDVLTLYYNNLGERKVICSNCGEVTW